MRQSLPPERHCPMLAFRRITQDRTRIAASSRTFPDTGELAQTQLPEVLTSLCAGPTPWEHTQRRQQEDTRQTVKNGSCQCRAGPEKSPSGGVDTPYGTRSRGHRDPVARQGSTSCDCSHGAKADLHERGVTRALYCTCSELPMYLIFSTTGTL